jgi:excisionase family DNA binding protein
MDIGILTLVKTDRNSHLKNFYQRINRMDEKIYTIPEVAAYLKMSRSKVYNLVQGRKIPYIRINRNVRIRETDLKKWIEKNIVTNF